MGGVVWSAADDRQGTRAKPLSSNQATASSLIDPKASEASSSQASKVAAFNRDLLAAVMKGNLEDVVELVNGADKETVNDDVRKCSFWGKYHFK
jgi:hypothetical protein